ncbi:hypothetical protein QUA43_01975 [Microcoleus sp. N9_B4]|uniref:hypothetical protein n=1 Tax=Microcoleus sp. N9_B4 TaxID=3055386 RepID=UPI002FCFF6DA
MLAIIDPVTATIVLSAIAGAVVGKKGKHIIDGLAAANTATNFEKGVEFLERENSKDR